MMGGTRGRLLQYEIRSLPNASLTTLYSLSGCRVAFCGASDRKFLLSQCNNIACTFTTPFSLKDEAKKPRQCYTSQRLLPIAIEIIHILHD